ncbi:MAG TPA: RNA 2',3'-cyclic phosphodiesterase [Thermomicrobiales bacterium]|nr:RNA 2',3'-cyclic phosphodiesterase [Thermomicrobiales bacterium]
MENNDGQQPQRRTPKQRRQRFVRERPPEESEDTPWRLFIAVPLPDEVRAVVARIIADLRGNDWPIRWTDPDNAHLTLHFLGDTAPENAELLRLALGEAIAPHAAFDLRTADLGAFPSIKRPRVLWLGLWGPAHRLDTIRNDIGSLLQSFEVELDEKEFRPHITLGRVRDSRTIRVRDLPGTIRTRFEELATSGEVTHEKPVPFPVREVHLVRSHLSREGARYEVIGRYPLKASKS